MDRLDTGTHRGTGTPRTELVDATAQEDQELSALGEAFEATPMVVPIRAHLDNFKVAEYGRDSAIAGFLDTLFAGSFSVCFVVDAFWNTGWFATVVQTRGATVTFLWKSFRKSHPTAHDRSDCHGAHSRAWGSKLPGKTARGTR